MARQISRLDSGRSFSDSSMERLLRRRDRGLGASIADSTMMWMVHEEMQRAHEKVKTKDSTARLNEISKFYQLAVIQLDVCHRFMQQENKDDRHWDLLDDLASIRDHLRGRLVESEAAIAGKDRELMEMADSEKSLRKELEAKERELVLLRSRSESQKTEEDEETENVPAEVETSGIGGSRGGGSLERMASDVDAFKETFDLAFGKMRDAIVMPETESSDQMLRSAVERDVLVALEKEFVTDLNARMAVREGLAGSQVSELLSAFMRLVYVKLSEHAMRLEDLKGRMDSCTELVTSLRRKKQQYRKAFIITSQNLQKAENEVDLLADQVDRLLYLLESVYAKLRGYSSLLGQHFEVSELLASIHTELKGA